MKYLAILVAAASMLLSGCATTIRSDVTAFNNWPAALQDKSYVFVAPQGAEDTLEYRSYQVLVSQELAKLGFSPANDPHVAQLQVGMHFRTVDQPVQLLLAYDPFWGPGYPGRFGYRGFYRPYYDPLFAPVNAEDALQHVYQRQLRITIDAVDGRKLFDVTVNNASRIQATPNIMPALVQSAFAGFPGQSGVPRSIDFTIDPKAGAPVLTPAPAAAPAKASGAQG